MMIIFQLLPFVIELMKLAEKAMIDEPNSGAAKKELVVDGLKTVITAADGLSTGGQKETWAKIQEPLTEKNGIIDRLAGILFKFL